MIAHSETHSAQFDFQHIFPFGQKKERRICLTRFYFRLLLSNTATAVAMTTIMTITIAYNASVGIAAMTGWLGAGD